MLTLEHAMRLLGAPRVPAEEELRENPAASAPFESWVRAIEMPEPDLARFAAAIVLRREGRRLVPRHHGERFRIRDAHHCLWIVHGTLAVAEDGHLVISRMLVDSWPAAQSWATKRDPFRGVTAEVLRAISPASIITEAAAFLRRNAALSDWAERRGVLSRPAEQTEKATRIASAGVRPTAVTERQLAGIARRYLELIGMGYRRGIHRELALEFGITEAASRTRIRRARQAGLLPETVKGRASG